MNFIEQYKSPNYSTRHDAKIDILIVHHTAGDLKASLAWLCDQKSQVSAHLLVAQNGDIYSLVDLADKAWHAGKSQYDFNGDGRIFDLEFGLNARSIGIELVSDGVFYTDQQMGVLTMLCLKFMHVYSIEPRHVLGHKEVSMIGKIDPANFDMNKLRTGITWLKYVRNKVIVE